MTRPETTPANGRADNLFILLVFTAVVLVLLVVVLSAGIRLHGNGLGCADWPACYGPQAAHSGQLPVPTTGTGMPERAVPAWATLLHRLTATILGVIIFGIVISAWRRRPRTNLGVPLILLGLTVFLSILGYQTPAPRMPWVTLGNLLGGMIMLALLWWLGQRSVGVTPAAASTPRHLRPWALGGLALLFVQIFLGGWTSANFAAAACMTLPGCPGAGLTSGAIFDALSPFRTVTLAGHALLADTGAKTIHMIHRAGALITFLYLGWLGLRAAGEAGLRGAGTALLVLLLLQVILGVSAIIFTLPLAVVTLHNTVAALLLLTMVNLVHLLYPAAGGDPARARP